MAQPILTNKVKCRVAHRFTQFDNPKPLQEALSVAQLGLIPTTHDQFHLSYHAYGQDRLILDSCQAVNCRFDFLCCINQNITINDGQRIHALFPHSRCR